MAQITKDTIDVWDGWQRRELLVERCRACGTWIHLPKHICPACWSDDVAVEPADGAGHLVAYSFPRTAPDATDPVISGIVSLDNAEGVQLLARIVNCAPSDVSGGMPVSLTWYEDDGVTVPAFAPAGSTR